MITPAYAQAMARYNAWQNTNIYDAAATLDDLQRKQNRGAFFGSIHATLNHILWADQMWLMRFGAAERPAATLIADGLSQFEDWDALRAARHHFDRVIQSWANELRLDDVAGDLTWFSAGVGREVTTSRALLVTHIFNHQTHHRGQVHALLTSFGVKPGVTDMPFGPPLTP
ncbi:MAG: DinB family protein [Hyphomicrobium sp.]